MTLKALTDRLGDQIHSVEEETFNLFAQDLPSGNLGFIDPKSAALELTVAGRDITLHQSPSLLASNRAGGTTGAVVWKITPSFATWLTTPDNLLFATGVLSATSAVIELGCGISPIVGLLLSPRIGRYLLTDQSYVARLVEQNLEANSHLLVRPSPERTPSGGSGGRRSRARVLSPGGKSAAGKTTARIGFTPLDWESDEVTPSLAGGGSARGSFDAVLACDCIYNEALIEPFVQTCVDICRLREEESEENWGTEERKPCVCVVAQQLRDHDVFEAWLERFARPFNVWRIPDECLSEALRSNSGYVVHIGILKGAVRVD